MAALTDDMTRLWGEIEAMRGMRAVLMSQLEHATRDRRSAISAMRADFAHAHAEMARATKADRVTLISSLKRAVAGQQQGIKEDLSGALRAWSGPAPEEREALESQRLLRLQSDAQAREKSAQSKFAQERSAQEKPKQEKPANEKLSLEKREEERPVFQKKQGKERKEAAPNKMEGASATNERRSAQSISSHGKNSKRRR
jgi:hypothetical protein